MIQPFMHAQARSRPSERIAEQRLSRSRVALGRDQRPEPVSRTRRRARALAYRYKRINAPLTASGATWSPNTISYSGNNRTHMIRIPDVDRFELRLADGAANPHLLQAAVLAAGLDGIVKQRNPGRRCDNNMYVEPLPAAEVRWLPNNLFDAVRALRSSDEFRVALGAPFVEAFTKLKEGEWSEHHSHVSAWERQMTLDC